MVKPFGIACSVTALLSPPVWAQTPVKQVGAFTFAVQVAAHILQVPYEASRSIGETDTLVRRAVVLVPGSARNSAGAYDTLRDAAALAHAADGTSLLVAPQFLIELDITTYQLPADHLFWTDNGWKQGDQSTGTAAHPRPAAISSFAVLDSMLYQIAARNPNLQSVVVGGHSAGGQFVNRYAAGSSITQALQNQFGVEVSFVSANPSSYLYFDRQRPAPPAVNQFAVPPAAVTGACPEYDDYKYGLRNRNAYMSRLSTAQILAQYPAQRMTYLLGELDNDPAAVDLDTMCEASLQGAHRLERGTAYGFYVRHFFGGAAAVTHRPVVVPGVGHDSRAMFTSPCGVDALFGGAGCDPVDAASGRDLGEPGSLLFVDVRPNPFRDRITVVYAVSDPARPVSLRVYDVRGHRVRTLREGLHVQGRALAVWDGHSDAGEMVPAGVYMIRLQQQQVTLTERVTLVR